MHRIAPSEQEAADQFRSNSAADLRVVVPAAFYGGWIPSQPARLEGML